MKLTLEDQPVTIDLDDRHFPLARLWKGATEDGDDRLPGLA